MTLLLSASLFTGVYFLLRFVLGAWAGLVSVRYVLRIRHDLSVLDSALIEPHQPLPWSLASDRECACT